MKLKNIKSKACESWGAELLRQLAMIQANGEDLNPKNRKAQRRVLYLAENHGESYRTGPSLQLVYCMRLVETTLVLVVPCFVPGLLGTLVSKIGLNLELPMTDVANPKCILWQEYRTEAEMRIVAEALRVLLYPNHTAGDYLTEEGAA